MPGPTFIPGEHVDLKTIEEEDLEFLQRGKNDPSIARFMTLTPYDEARTRQEFEQSISGGQNLNLLVVPREGEFAGDPVGHVCINPLHRKVDRGTLAVWLLPEAQRNKFAEDGLAHLVEYGFEQIGLHRLSINTSAKNLVIQRMCERAGFTEEGVAREFEYIDGEYVDQYRYGLLESEWMGLEAALDTFGVT